MNTPSNTDAGPYKVIQLTDRHTPTYVLTGPTHIAAFWASKYDAQTEADRLNAAFAAGAASRDTPPVPEACPASFNAVANLALDMTEAIWTRVKGIEQYELTNLAERCIYKGMELRKKHVPSTPPIPRSEVDGDWISVEDRLPEPGAYVLAYVIDTSRPNWSRRIRAQYAGLNTLELSDDHDPWLGCTQIQEGGDWYVEAGWYESNEYEETNWRVSDLVTHWMPIPEPPK